MEITHLCHEIDAISRSFRIQLRINYNNEVTSIQMKPNNTRHAKCICRQKYKSIFWKQFNDYKVHRSEKWFSAHFKSTCLVQNTSFNPSVSFICFLYSVWDKMTGLKIAFFSSEPYMIWKRDLIKIQRKIHIYPLTVMSARQSNYASSNSLMSTAQNTWMKNRFINLSSNKLLTLSVFN